MPGVLGNAPPIRSLNTWTSTESQDVVPSTSYGLGCVVSVMTACPDTARPVVLVIDAVIRTGRFSEVKSLVSVKTAW